MPGDEKSKRVHCPICREYKVDCVPGTALNLATIADIRKVNPRWSEEDTVCPACLLRIMESADEEEAAAKDPRSYGERMADKVTAFVGSWAFLGWQTIFLAVWIIFNTVAIFRYHFDPYPFILFNLLISWAGAIEAPIILMSQNRQDTRDRLRDEKEYKTNLVAEEEIRQLHEKLDEFIGEYQCTLSEIRNRPSAPES